MHIQSLTLDWGFNPKARWEALNFYDKADINGTELRVFEGNFLFSTGQMSLQIDLQIVILIFR